jgi:hypothetical protein
MIVEEVFGVLQIICDFFEKILRKILNLSITYLELLRNFLG